MRSGYALCGGRLFLSFGETACAMSKRESDWHVPGDWLAILGMMVIIPSAALLVSMVLPALTGDVAVLYGLGVGAGVVAAILLFMARLPLYRARRFWTFGPRLLDRRHRWYYWLAYIAVGISLVLLWVVWLRAS